MASTRTKKIIKWSLIGFAVLFVALCTHIYVVTDNMYEGHSNWELRRIDFKQPVDSTQANLIKGVVASIPGVTNSYFNLEQYTLVYGAEPKTVTASMVFKKVMASGNYKAEMFIPPVQSGGCPVMKGSEVTRRLAVYFARFHSN